MSKFTPEDATKALDYLENRISHILRGEPVRDLDEALSSLRLIIEALAKADGK